jgi:CRP-like cAMP-binding protein
LKKIYDRLKHNPLFHAIAYDDFEKVLGCLGAKALRYGKGDVLLLAGEDVAFVGLIVSGKIKIVKEDERGNISMLTELSESEMFGEILAYADISQSPVTIQAATDCEILLIDHKKIISGCSSECWAACLFHRKLIENMSRIIAKKNFLLNRKIEILSKRTTREKLMCFFDFYREGEREFSIPYNREEMANYLCVDRSAMSNELCKMRDEGVLTFYKNRFRLL